MFFTLRKDDSLGNKKWFFNGITLSFVNFIFKSVEMRFMDGCGLQYHQHIWLVTLHMIRNKRTQSTSRCWAEDKDETLQNNKVQAAEIPPHLREMLIKPNLSGLWSSFLLHLASRHNQGTLSSETLADGRVHLTSSSSPLGSVRKHVPSPTTAKGSYRTQMCPTAQSRVRRTSYSHSI